MDTKDKTQKNFLSIWAIFEEKITNEINFIKKKIQSTHNCPDFHPHLTLSCCFDVNLSNLDEYLQRVALKLNTFKIETSGYDYENKFFQSFFLNVKKNVNFIKQKKKIDEIFNTKSFNFKPHISLFYGNLTKEQKIQLINLLPKYDIVTKIDKIALALNDEHNLKWKIVKVIDILN